MIEFGYNPRELDEHVWRLDRFYCKKFLQCLLLLVFVLWLLYQIDYILRLKKAYAYNHRIKDIDFQNQQIEKLLGRKGGIVLYQTGFSRAAKGMTKNEAEVIKENENSEEDDAFLKDSESWIRYGEFSTRENVKGNEDSIMKVGPLILKNGEQKLEVSKHESGPSRRTDIQVQSFLDVNESRSGMPSKEMVGVEEIEDVTVAVDSGQAAMRDLLQNDS
ncbi:uncharacterized protein LOC130815438 isoform X1 [Amaranthus tricolor]|uniref:uncharacterized protein LOC130815438 isoform X1 n=1 Tax=Amaranthus tricolor TaxID=29722 RepID=UPI00258E5FE7|nr:uncharacterized protein LOC130815438 isoform X1 [Amaranthus tricolor]